MLSFSQMDINIVVRRGYSKAIDKSWLAKITREILNAAGVDITAEFSLLVTGQAQIRKIYKQWLDEDTPTDVLSFPMRDKNPNLSNFVEPPDGALHLGEVIISYPQAVIQAQQHRHPVKKEIAILLIHGLLHLLSYDHDTVNRRRNMRAQESAILKTIEENYL